MLTIKLSANLLISHIYAVCVSPSGQFKAPKCIALPGASLSCSSAEATEREGQRQGDSSHEYGAFHWQPQMNSIISRDGGRVNIF